VTCPLGVPRIRTPRGHGAAVAGLRPDEQAGAKKNGLSVNERWRVPPGEAGRSRREGWVAGRSPPGTTARLAGHLRTISVARGQDGDQSEFGDAETPGVMAAPLTAGRTRRPPGSLQGPGLGIGRFAQADQQDEPQGEVLAAVAALIRQRARRSRRWPRRGSRAVIRGCRRTLAGVPPGRRWRPQAAARGPARTANDSLRMRRLSPATMAASKARPTAARRPAGPGPGGRHQDQQGEEPAGPAGRRRSRFRHQGVKHVLTVLTPQLEHRPAHSMARAPRGQVSPRVGARLTAPHAAVSNGSTEQIMIQVGDHAGLGRRRRRAVPWAHVIAACWPTRCGGREIGTAKPNIAAARATEPAVRRSPGQIAAVAARISDSGGRRSGTAVIEPPSC